LSPFFYDRTKYLYVHPTGTEVAQAKERT